MLPGYLDDAVVGFVLLRRASGTPEIIDANRTAAELLALDRSALVGRPVATVPGLETIASHWTDPSADGDSPVVVRARVGPAARRHVQLTLTEQPDGGALLQVVDQTDEERLWDALDQERAITESTIERTTSNFSRAVSHELRTPLASMLGCSELLLEADSDHLTAQQRRLVESIERNGRRLRGLVMNLIHLATMDTGGFTLARHDIDFAEVLQHSLDSIARLVHARHIDVRVTSDPGAYRVHGDPEKLHHVIHNLLSNAVANSHLGGRIRVRLEHEDDVVVLRVSDDGPGIPRHRQPTVFQRAYRTTNDSPENNAGLGIGLNVAEAIVIAHGGSLDVTSTPGEGAQFSLRLQSAPFAALGLADQEAS
jgi:signal transduction histidine kinase